MHNQNWLNNSKQSVTKNEISKIEAGKILKSYEQQQKKSETIEFSFYY